MLKQQMDSTQKQVASLGTEPEKTDPLREEQVRELQAQLETLRSKMHQMEALERTFSDAQRQLEVRVGHTRWCKLHVSRCHFASCGCNFADTENPARRRGDEEKAPSCLTRGVCHPIFISTCKHREPQRSSS